MVQPENVASFRTRGIDFNVNYLLDPARLGMDADIGTLRLSLIGSRLDRLTTIPTLGAAQIDERTTADLQSGTCAPKWTTTFDTTWEFRGLTVNYGYNYFSAKSIEIDQDRSPKPAGRRRHRGSLLFHRTTNVGQP